MKNRTIKRAVALGMLVLVMANIIIPNNVQASGMVDGDMTIEEGAEPFIQSEEDKKIEAEKMAALEAFIAEEEAMQADASVMATSQWYYLSTTFPGSKQENSYYCGPATVQNVVRFHTGKVYTQLYCAQQLGTTTAGTDMTKIAPVLKNLTGKNYVMSSIENETLWKRRVANNVIDSKMAVVLDINSQSSSSWPYKTSGHYISIYACYGSTTTSCTKVKIADSHPNYNRKWEATASAAYQVNNAHFRKSMIW